MKHWFALHLFLGLLLLTGAPVYAQDPKPVWGKTHLSVVLAVAFSPDGKWLAGAGADQTIRIWSISGGREWLTLKGHTEPINCLAFGRHGRTLASGSADGTIRLWELQGSRRVRTLPGEVGVDSLAFSPDGRWLVSGSGDHAVKLWDTTLSKLARTLRSPFASGFELLEKGARTLVAFSPDGRAVAIGTFENWGHNADHGLVILDLKTDQELRIPEESPEVLVYSPHGTMLAAASNHYPAPSTKDREITLWDPANGRLLRKLQGHTGAVVSLAFSADSRWLASGSVDQTVKIWNTTTGKLLYTLKGFNDRVFSVAFSPNGRWLATGCGDGTVKLWEMSQGK